MIKLRRTDAIWLGGLMSGSGAFRAVRRNGRTHLQLYFVRGRRDALPLVSKVTGKQIAKDGILSMKYHRTVESVKFQGAQVDNLIEQVRPWLSDETYRRYIKVKGIVRERNEYRDAKKAREALAVALDRRRTIESMRERAERLYSNDDPAVTIIHDNINLEWVDEKKLRADEALRLHEQAKAEAMLANPLGNHDTAKPRRSAPGEVNKRKSKD